MKIKSNMPVPKKLLEIIRQAFYDSKGTDEYYKYSMCCESKYRRKGDTAWSKWHYNIHSVPLADMSYHFKVLKETVYIVSEEYSTSQSTTDMDRWEVNEAVKALIDAFDEETET